MAVETDPWLNAELCGGRYSVQSFLGEGGMARVYCAFDRSLQTDVVIKVPHVAMFRDPEFAARFRRETRVLVTLSHPHIARILDTGELEDVPFLVLPYLVGGSLADRQQRSFESMGRSLPMNDLAGWLPQIADALDFIHRRGYVHRDVKPANILFDDLDHAYLADFGVAKAFAGSAAAQTAALTATGLVVGTPEYLAPECVMGRNVDGRADQYALAITVYEILSGDVPFSGETPAAVLVHQSTQVPEPLSNRNRSIGPAVSNIVMRALSKNPAERFATCTEFAELVIQGLAQKSALPIPQSPQPVPEFMPSAPQTFTQEVAGAATVTTPVAVPRVKCPGCGQVLSLRPQMMNPITHCPKCRHVFDAAMLPTSAVLSSPSAATHPSERSHSRRGWFLGSAVMLTAALLVYATIQLTSVRNEPSERLVGTSGGSTPEGETLPPQTPELSKVSPPESESIDSDAGSMPPAEPSATVSATIDWTTEFPVATISPRSGGVVGGLPDAERRKFAEQVAEQTRRIGMNPTDGEAFFQRGYARDQLGDTAQAKQDYAECIRFLPTASGAFNNRGIIWMEEGNHSEALKDFNSSVKLLPQEAAPLINRAQLNNNLSRYEEALQDTNAAAAFIPKDATTSVVSFFRPRSDFTQPSLRVTTTHDFLLFQRTRAHFGLMNFNAAKSDISQYLQTNPNDTAAHYWHGRIHQEENDWGGGLDCFSKMIQLDAQNVEAHYGLGNSLWMTNKLDAAVLEMTNALALDPDHFGARRSRMFISKQQEKLGRAMEDLKVLLRTSPKSAELYVARAQIYLIQKDHETAIADCNRALQETPQNVDAIVARSIAYGRMKQFSLSLADRRLAYEVAPKDPRTGNELAWMLATCVEARIRDGAEALRLAREVCELTEWKNADYLDTLAASYAEVGNFSDAVQYQSQAVTLARSVSAKNVAEMERHLEVFRKRQPHREVQ